MKTTLEEIVERQDLEYYGYGAHLVAKGPEGYAQILDSEMYSRYTHVSGSHRAVSHSRHIGYAFKAVFYDNTNWYQYPPFLWPHLIPMTKTEAYETILERVRYARRELAHRLQELIEQTKCQKKPVTAE